MPHSAVVVPDQRTFWDRWHEVHSVASHRDHADAALSAFLAALTPPPGGPVLEVGCGQGREAIKLARAGFPVSAFDHSPVAIEIAESAAHRECLPVDFRVHDATQPLPYPAGHFRAVFAHLSLHYFDDQTTRKVFSEIARVLQSAGVLYFTVRSVRDPLYGQGEQLGEQRFCFKGHVRHFFDLEYVQDVLADWELSYADYYDTSDRTVNPGVFIRVLARSNRRSTFDRGADR